MPFLKHYRPHLLLLPLKRPIYPNRKAHLSLSTMAILAFRVTIAHPTSSIFHADQCGMRGFLIPWWTPTSARPGTVFSAYFIEDILVGIVKLVIWIFSGPLRHLDGVQGPSPTPWGTPTSARPGTDCRAHFIEKTLLGILKLVNWKFFLTPPKHCIEFVTNSNPYLE